MLRERLTACVTAKVPTVVTARFRASAVTLSISQSTSSSQHQKLTIFKVETLKTKLKINFSKVVQQHYVGEMGKSITCVLHIFPIYSVPNIVEIGQYNYVDTTVK